MATHFLVQSADNRFVDGHGADAQSQNTMVTEIERSGTSCC
jgi:hypothetical protein